MLHSLRWTKWLSPSLVTLVLVLIKLESCIVAYACLEYYNIIMLIKLKNEILSKLEISQDFLL